MLSEGINSFISSLSTDYKLPRSRFIAHQSILVVFIILLLNLILEITIDLEATSFWLLAPFVFANFLMLLWSYKYETNLSAAHIALEFAIIQAHLLSKPEYFHVVVYWIPFLPIQALLTKGVKHFKWWFLVMSITVLFDGFYGAFTVGEKYSTELLYVELTIVGVMFLASITAFVYLLYVLLGNAYARMKQKNEEIERLNKTLSIINDSLEHRVKKRTKDIEEQKSILEKLAFMNSHIVRSSLSKIIGAAAVLEMDDEKHDEMIEVIIKSSNELDSSVREMGRELS